MNNVNLEQALRFIAEHNELVFATCEDSYPQLRAFQVMHIEGSTLYFATSPHKDVYRQLQANPHIELLTMADQTSVRCKGDADFNVDDAHQQLIFQRNPVLPRLYSDYTEIAYFKMSIRALDYYDLKPTPPLFLHFDLQHNTVAHGFVGTRYSPSQAQ